MALYWDLQDIENRKSVCWRKCEEKNEKGEDEFELTGITNSLIWLTMIIGMNQITEKNCGEFYARVEYLERIAGAMMKQGSKDRYVKLDDVITHIGLKTNASQYTELMFIKNCGKNYLKPLVFARQDEAKEKLKKRRCKNESQNEVVQETAVSN